MYFIWQETFYIPVLSRHKVSASPMASGPLRCSTLYIRLHETCHAFLAAFLRSPSRLSKSGWCVLMFIEIARKTVS